MYNGEDISIGNHGISIEKLSNSSQAPTALPQCPSRRPQQRHRLQRRQPQQPSNELDVSNFGSVPVTGGRIAIPQQASYRHFGEYRTLRPIHQITWYLNWTLGLYINKNWILQQQLKGPFGVSFLQRFLAEGIYATFPSLTCLIACMSFHPNELQLMFYQSVHNPRNQELQSVSKNYSF